MSRHLSDWLEYYLRYTENSEPPLKYHLWSGIAAIASVLQRKCFTNWGLVGYRYPNMYIALIGPPGGRKGTAMKIAKSMVQEIDIPLGSDALGSAQALYKELERSKQSYLTFDGQEKYHKSLSVWSEEFQVFLSDKDPRFMSSLTDLFDAPDCWTYHSLRQGVEKLDNCWLSIIGAITPSLLQSKLSMDAVGGGLLSRIMLVVEYGPKRRIAFQFLSKQDMELRQLLLEDLQQIALLSGPFHITQEFMNAYGPWYEQFSETNEIDSDKFLGYNSRRATHLQKLCMIISASASNDMDITAEHFNRALAIMEMTEAEMPNAFYGVGNAAHTETYAKFLSRVTEKEQVFYEDLIAHFQMIAMPNDIDQMMSLAEKAGQITIETSVTGKTLIKAIHKQNHKAQAEAYLSNTLFRKMRGNQFK